jgi:hypothetical protein
MQKNVKLVISPFSSGLEVIENLIMKAFPPYSDSNVTIQFNPNIQEYKENQDQPGIQVRQMTVSTPTNQSKKVNFDFNRYNVHDIHIDDVTYSVKLMNIGQENAEGQDFPFFEFLVSWD